jgi:alpha-D-ribose 1-methylphosphonate 5-triphosphate synthase subunit PhnH
MRFDAVHDTQKAYRQLIDCISRPGTVRSMSEICGKLDLPVPCNKAMLVFAGMLLDTEVRFHILGHAKDEVTNVFGQFTYSAVAPLNEADFIFVLAGVDSTELVEAIAACKNGSLTDPHLSATMVVEAEMITNENYFALTGPGIQNENYINISVQGDWVVARAEKNVEFPLGIDMFFVDQKHRMCAIPRTTIIQQRGMHLWGM